MNSAESSPLCTARDPNCTWNAHISQTDTAMPAAPEAATSASGAPATAAPPRT